MVDPLPAGGTTRSEASLRRRVRESAAPVALFDCSEPRFLELSSSAREQLGFGNRDVATLDMLDYAGDPDAATRLIALIRDGYIPQWSWQGSLNAPDGRRIDYRLTGRAFTVHPFRRLGMVRFYVQPEGPSERVELLGPEEDVEEDGFPPPGDDQHSMLFMVDRLAQLERHLTAIAREIDAAQVHNNEAMPSMLTELSDRQLEIVSRLLAGERVPTIARVMYLSQKTVRTHLSHVFRKFGVHSQAELLEMLRRRP